LDFDRITRTEKVYDDHRKFTLRIHYDNAGRPTLWAPSSRLNGVNVTYSPGGHVAGIQRGTMSVRMEYDQNGRISSQIFADGKSWSYTYLEKVRILVVVAMLIKWFIDNNAILRLPGHVIQIHRALKVNMKYSSRVYAALSGSSTDISRNVIKTCLVHRRR